MTKSQRLKYVEVVFERAREEWPDEGTVEEKWNTIQTALVEAAVETLGRTKRKQCDWFYKYEDSIRPYLKRQNSAYTKWLASSDWKDLVQFR